MNNDYAQTILYAYPAISNQINVMESYIKRKAYHSVFNYHTPCEEQCKQLLELIAQKNALFVLKDAIDKTLKGFKPSTLTFFKYDYFGEELNGDYVDHNYKSDEFKQRAIKAFAFQLELHGISDKYVDRELLSMPFMQRYLNKVMKKKEKASSGCGICCVYCGAQIPEGRQICPICEEILNDNSLLEDEE